MKRQLKFHPELESRPRVLDTCPESGILSPGGEHGHCIRDLSFRIGGPGDRPLESLPHHTFPKALTIPSLL